jgi:hypothetical protein
MKRTNVVVVVALALGVFACDRKTDRASETNITSGPMQPGETMATTGASLADEQSPAAPLGPEQATTDGGTKDGGRPRTSAGVTTGTQSGATGNPNSGTTASPDDGTVAPGHIMFPPDKGPGTGAPNSNGSHNLGSGAGAGKR